MIINKIQNIHSNQSILQGLIESSIISTMQPYQQQLEHSREISLRMRMGTGVSTLLQQSQAPTHYMDALQRFQKDYASYDKLKRQEQMRRRQKEIEKRRIEMLQRQSRRWQLMEEYERNLKSRDQRNAKMQNLGIRRTANSSGLPYNLISLEYQRNPQGQKLRYLDQQKRIRTLVRAHNMDSKGNCKYNLLNGAQRVGVSSIVPQDLKGRFENRLHSHYESQRIKLPVSMMQQ